MSNATIQAYRTAAADLQNGWIQCHWQADGRKCLVQALADAVGISLTPNNRLPAALVVPLDTVLSRQPEYRAIKTEQQQKYLHDPTMTMTQSLVYWNDADGRTPTEVINLLTTTAVQLELDALRQENHRLQELTSMLLGINRRLRRLTVFLADRVILRHPELGNELNDPLDNQPAPVPSLTSTD